MLSYQREAAHKLEDTFEEEWSEEKQQRPRAMQIFSLLMARALDPTFPTMHLKSIFNQKPEEQLLSKRLQFAQCVKNFKRPGRRDPDDITVTSSGLFSRTSHREPAGARRDE